MGAPNYGLRRGTSPLLVSLPHVGTGFVGDFKRDFVPRALDREDTDWHLTKLYRFAIDLGATFLASSTTRYVIDLNRSPDNAPMYPGANNTELCPTRFFTGDKLYRDGCEPNEREIEHRRRNFWQPYHDALRGELERIKSIHGYALLFDGHSIRSEIPWLFPGRLPDFSLGTADGTSCDQKLSDLLFAKLQSFSEHYSSVRDERFKGGYITRHYGRPAENVHAVQLEMCQCLYMNETPPFDYLPNKAMNIRFVLQRLLEDMKEFVPEIVRHG